MIEGQREIQLALKGDFLLQRILFCPEIISEATIQSLRLASSSETAFIEISMEVYQKLAYRGSTEGVIALAKTKDVSLQKMQLPKKNCLILVAEAPEKPGNIGALLRTADAAKLDAVIIANPKTDLFNPNIIRSSVGTLFTNQIATGTTSEIIAFLQQHKIAIYAASLQSSVPYTNCDFKAATAIVVGTEADGLSADWVSSSQRNIVIPMRGEIDSMNVSVAAGILIFEAIRQRAIPT